MEHHIVQSAVAAGVRKVTLKNDHICHYLLRSVLAGLYLGLIVFMYWSLAQNLAPDPFGKVVAALFFGVGLFVIVVTNSELFTSNNMFLTVSSLARQTSWIQTVRLWSVCYIGNLIGSLFIAMLVCNAGLLDSMPDDHALYRGAILKTELTAWAIFFRGILANWVVCMAIWVSMHLKEDLARMMAIILIISVFVYLGFEHSIANMGTFSLALLGPHQVPILGVGHNLLWATVGNIVGGGFFIGALYWSMNRDAPLPPKGKV